MNDSILMLIKMINSLVLRKYFDNLTQSFTSLSYAYYARNITLSFAPVSYLTAAVVRTRK